MKASRIIRAIAELSPAPSRRKPASPPPIPSSFLGNADPNAGDWIYQGTTNYLFWTTGDTNGNFSNSESAAGQLRFVFLCAGHLGPVANLQHHRPADQTNNLGVISWNPPHLQQRLWRVGTPDHTSKEFRFGRFVQTVRPVVALLE
jgi:hypothetical protein